VAAEVSKVSVIYAGKECAVGQTWIMDVTWTVGDPANSIGLPKGGEAVQVERVVAACKVPKNGMVADVDG